MGIAANGVPWYDSRPGHMTIKSTGEKTYTFMNGLPGRYRIRDLFTIYLSDDGRKIVLYTGYRPLEVYDPTAWGERKGGLQAGIKLTTSRSAYRLGAVVTTESLVRNVSNEDITYDVPRLQSFNRATVEIIGADGKPRPIHLATVTSTNRSGPRTLKPGETIVVVQRWFTASKQWQIPETLDWPGRYRVVDNIGGLLTGLLEFDVRAQPIGDVGNVY
jgi:hypothetical protein